MLTQCHVDTAETGSNRRGNGTLDGNFGLGDSIENMLGQRRAVLLHNARTGLLYVPIDLDTRGVDHAPHGRSDLGADTVSGNQYNVVCHALLLVLIFIGIFVGHLSMRALF